MGLVLIQAELAVREEFLELLRTEPAFREEARRLLLTDDLLALPGRVVSLTESVGQSLFLLREIVGVVRDLATAQQRTEVGLQRQGTQVQSLIGAQQRTEEELRRLVIWQRGESGRRDGERYERETLRRAPALFNGGQGGAPDQPWVQQQLTEQLSALMERGMFEVEEDPFLADLLWWKGEQVAVVEISLQVNGYDVVRAARRAGTLRRAGAQALAVVIGEDWATPESQERALARHVAWKVGSDLSEDFLTFRRTPSEAPGEACDR